MLLPVQVQTEGDEDSGTTEAEPAGLVLGPILRYVGTTTATVWVETDRPTSVEVLGHQARTFEVLGHHYALVLIEGLEPGTTTPYDVHLGRTRVWPLDDGRPAPVVRTRQGERSCRLVFGSCRVAAPAEPPYSLEPAQHREGLGVDALWAFAQDLQAGRAEWPDGLLLLGDQMYVDDVSPETAEFIRARRDVSQPPGESIADFEEYTRLHRESWSEPEIRWLLSTVPSAMIFDDHEVSDDWNISQAWVDDVRRLPWWDERVTAAFMAYWLYQHLGNLSPPELVDEPVLAALQRTPGTDGGPRLRELARQWDRETASSRWAYHRDFGRSRLLVIDARAARVLTDGRRDMVDEGEWRWISEHARGDFDHLVIATTLPVFLPHGIHYLEAWNEAVCAGRWGRLAARWGESLRRACDLEHWAAFQSSFEQLMDLLREVSSGPNAPATITLLGGDVHTTYVAEVDLGSAAGSGAESEAQSSRVHQVVCSPFRNPMSTFRRRLVGAVGSQRSARVLSALARAARVSPPSATWDYRSERSYDNSVGELVLDHRTARVVVRRSLPLRDRRGRLAPVLDQQLGEPPQVELARTRAELEEVRGQARDELGELRLERDSRVAPAGVERCIEAVRAEGLTDLAPPVLRDLALAVLDIETNRTHGLLVETGAGRPGSAVVLAAAKDATRPLRVYDVSGDQAAEAMARLGFAPEAHEIRLVPSSVQDAQGSERLAVDEPVALAHLAGGDHDATLAALERVTPLLVPGGRLVVEAYLTSPGVRAAVDDYFKDRIADFRFEQRFCRHIVRR